MWWPASAVIRRSVSVQVAPMSGLGACGWTYAHIASVLATAIPDRCTTSSCRLTTSAGNPSLNRRLTLIPKKSLGGVVHVLADAPPAPARQAQASTAAVVRRLHSIPRVGAPGSLHSGYAI